MKPLKLFTTLIVFYSFLIFYSNNNFSHPEYKTLVKIFSCDQCHKYFSIGTLPLAKQYIRIYLSETLKKDQTCQCAIPEETIEYRSYNLDKTKLADLKKIKNNDKTTKSIDPIESLLPPTGGNDAEYGSNTHSEKINNENKTRCLFPIFTHASISALAWLTTSIIYYCLRIDFSKL